MDQKQAQFLEEDPTIERQWRALSLNTQAWFERWTRAGGGEVSREEGLMWTYNAEGSEAGMITISSVDALSVGEQVDHILDWYRQRRPLRGALCWYLASEPSGDLGARLFARGFEKNWQPHWMWLNLRNLLPRPAYPANLSIQLVEDESGWQVDDLPYYSTEDTTILANLRRAHPQQVRHLAALQENRVVGHCLINVTSGEDGVAGLYSMGVIPSARNQGIGTALVQAAGEFVRQIGCRHVILNATPMGEPVYRRVGFQSMGYGHTWYLPERTLAVPAPTKDRIAFVEAIGRGDIAALNEIGQHLAQEDLRAPLPGGSTPLDIAVYCQQPVSADWLTAHGVPLDLLSAWDLGWKERVPSLLAEQPELVKVQRGDWRLTPLHVAVQRNDIEFAKLLLTVPNDPEIKDAQFKASALSWARYFDRSEISTLIEQHYDDYRKPR